MVRRTKADAELTRQQIIDAARRMFHAHGVSRSTLDQIAREAGVTRGAVYWHFQDKQDLFYAMREQATLPLDRVDEDLLEETDDPLEGVRAAMLRMLTILEGDAAIREVFQIIIFRCEYVDEFAPVLGRINASCDNLVAKLEGAYRRAGERGLLRVGLDPCLLARDSVAFLTGMIDRWLAEPGVPVVTEDLRGLITQHVGLRRA
jgi:TetR/AcrR family acrAB operon transcriptional repressor